MVERSAILDLTFGALANSTRRDMLQRVSKDELSVGDLAQKYDHLTFAAVSKHLRVLQDAKLITKRGQGKLHLVTLSPFALEDAADYLRTYEQLWEDRLDSLEAYLKTLQ